MKRFIVIVLVIISLAGCATFNDAISGITSAVSDLGEASAEAVIMAPMFEFSMFYASYFFLGGYGFGDDNFKDGEGVTWSVVNQKEGSELTVKRALLKKMNDDTAWWYLSAVVDGEEHFYEMLLDDDYDVLKIRYLNPESGLIEEIVPETSEESEEETDTMNPEDYARFSVGEEKVKTKAGSFKAEHLVFEDDAQEEGSQFKYEYWISDRVPGHCVKYIMENISE